MAEDINVNVRFEQPEPLPPKPHRFRDCLWVIFAAALIGTAAGNSAVFAVVAACGIFMVVIGVRPHNTNSSTHTDTGSDVP